MTDLASALPAGLPHPTPFTLTEGPLTSTPLTLTEGPPTPMPLSLTEGPLFGLPLPEIWFGLVFVILGAFLFLDGFDFGVGALFATRSDETEREQFLAAIGPFWDGNEVWLVVFGGALFAAFPSVYANLFSRHYLLMFAILGALIARGVSPEFYEQRHDDRWHRIWGAAFVGGSVAAPFFLGMFTGNWLVGATDTLTLPGVVVGLALVALCVADGAAFLGVKTTDFPADLETYGVRAAAAYAFLAVLAVAYLSATGFDVLEPIPLALVALTAVLVGAYALAMRAGRYRLALATVAALVLGLVALVAVLMYPQVDPATDLAVGDAIVSVVPLNLMSIAAAILLPLVAVYFIVLYSAFGGPIEAGEAY